MRCVIRRKSCFSHFESYIKFTMDLTWFTDAQSDSNRIPNKCWWAAISYLHTFSVCLVFFQLILFLSLSSGFVQKWWWMKSEEQLYLCPPPRQYIHYIYAFTAHTHTYSHRNNIRPNIKKANENKPNQLQISLNNWERWPKWLMK